MKNWVQAYLGIGTNLGAMKEQLKSAVIAFRQHKAIKVRACSPVYRTKAVTDEPQPDYLNAVIAIETSLTANELVTYCHALEKKAGRIRHKPNAPRELDLDLLLYDQAVITDQSLLVPHPRMSERAFVLVPFNVIASDVIHPILKQTIGHLVGKVSPKDVVECCDESFWEENEGVTRRGK